MNFEVNYIDGILILSKSFEEYFTSHHNHLKDLLEAIQIEGFRYKITKCTFTSDLIKYLGYIIQNN